MEEEKFDPMLEKVEPNRRDFIKKVAIGTAYAVPVIASFSLDSVRNKAFAQATYTTPPVAPQYATQTDLGPVNGGARRLRVTFDQAMDTSVAPNADRRSRGVAVVCYNRTVCVDSAPIDRNDNKVVAAGCIDLPPGAYDWSWETNTSQLLTISGGYACGTVTYRFGMLPASAGCIDFKGTNGLALVPFEKTWVIACA